jgi:hypothetical protein
MQLNAMQEAVQEIDGIQVQVPLPGSAACKGCRSIMFYVLAWPESQIEYGLRKCSDRTWILIGWILKRI